jgi:hypothetical protein
MVEELDVHAPDADEEEGWVMVGAIRHSPQRARELAARILDAATHAEAQRRIVTRRFLEPPG